MAVSSRFSGLSVTHHFLVLVVGLALLFASPVEGSRTGLGRKQLVAAEPSSWSPSPEKNMTMADVFAACKNYSGVCNTSDAIACIAAIDKYRVEVYQIADDFCDCSDQIGAQLFAMYSPNVTGAVTFIHNCKPTCIWGNTCPFVATLLSVMSSNSSNLTAVGLVQLHPETGEVSYVITPDVYGANVSQQAVTVSILKGLPGSTGGEVVVAFPAANGSFSSQWEGRAKLADFGVARAIAYAPLGYHLVLDGGKQTTTNSSGWNSTAPAAPASVVAPVVAPVVADGNFTLRGALSTSVTLYSSLAPAEANGTATASSAADSGFASLVIDTIRLSYRLARVKNGSLISAKIDPVAGGANSTATAAAPLANSSGIALFGGASAAVPAFSGALTPPLDSILSLLSAPQKHTMNVNTTEGVLAGPLGTRLALSATLDPMLEVPAVEENVGSLGSTLTLTLGESYAEFVFTAAEGLNELITVAHLHEGKAGESGPVVAILFVDFQGPSVAGVVPLSSDVIAAIAAEPSSYYVNIHTIDIPRGAGRGQLHY
ncbi:hypothetical protein CBR_g36414 [Chara braunii]|uniref:CHRD domain-containing protein n=1 Tax=Chara braunii TaxID=69332 RepID=A0A388LKN8_CHABU|nr:hypothetical protein CBR_g36414 [Chara braunii]|eukprot:GBG82888.1 hypothetical protein CBR_g36414 [Chara braunii]